MLTYTALTTLPGKSQAEALGEALEALEPAPTGVGVFEVEDARIPPPFSKPRCALFSCSTRRALMQFMAMYKGSS